MASLFSSELYFTTQKMSRLMKCPVTRWEKVNTTAKTNVTVQCRNNIISTMNIPSIKHFLHNCKKIKSGKSYKWKYLMC